MNLSNETERMLVLKLLGLDGVTEKVAQNLSSGMVGKMVMVRTYSAGVHFGVLVEKDGQEALLSESQRVHYWDGACSLSQLATEGSKQGSSCRISVKVPEILLNRVIEVIPMTDSAIKNLQGIEIWRK